MRRGFWTDFQITPAAIFAAWPLELFVIFEAVTHPWLGWLLVSILVGGAVAIIWLRLRPVAIPAAPVDAVLTPDAYPCVDCKRPLANVPGGRCLGCEHWATSS
jgi:hypothetical protein